MDIKAVNKANPDFSNHPRIDFGYGTCTKRLGKSFKY